MADSWHVRAQRTPSCPRNPEQMSTFHIAFAPPPPPGGRFRVWNAACERVTWKCRALIGCWLIAIPSCFACGPSRAILSVTSHLREGQAARRLSVACAGNVHQMCRQHNTVRHLVRCVCTNKWRCWSAGRRVCFQAVSRHCVFRNNRCKMPSL